MRLARVQDYRRALDKASDWPFKLLSFEFADVPSLGTGSFSFNSPITIVAGSNGSGKTTLIHAVWASLDPASAMLSSKAQSRLGAGTGSIEVCHDGTNVKIATDFVRSTKGVSDFVDNEIVFLDTASEIARLQGYFDTLSDEDELINGIGALPIIGKELEDICWISGKEYTSLNLYEVEDVSGDFAFFEATLGGQSYDSQTMGAGELAVLFIWWKLFRARSNSVVLLEEPETFVSSRSQSKLAEFIISQTIKKKLFVLITSHSSRIVSAFGVKRGLFLYRTEGGVAFQQSDPHPSLLEQIGLEASVDVMVYVEDEAGAEFLHYILEEKDPNLSRRCDIVSVGGESQITGILTRVVKRQSKVRVLGGYDGDQRSLVPQGLNEMAVFLPGTVPIELSMRLALTSNISQFESLAGVKGVAQIASSLHGLDIHDWFEELCKQIGRTKKQVYPDFFRLLMLHVEGFSAQSEALVAEIRGRLEYMRM